MPESDPNAMPCRVPTSTLISLVATGAGKSRFIALLLLTVKAVVMDISDGPKRRHSPALHLRLHHGERRARHGGAAALIRNLDSLERLAHCYARGHAAHGASNVFGHGEERRVGLRGYQP